MADETARTNLLE